MIKTARSLIISSARLLGLVHANSPRSAGFVFTDIHGNVVEFDPLELAADSEKLQCQMAVRVSHYSNGVVCSVEKLKPWVCLIKDFNNCRITALRWCVLYAADQYANEIYGSHFINQQPAGQEQK